MLNLCFRKKQYSNLAFYLTYNNNVDTTLYNTINSPEFRASLDDDEKAVFDAVIGYQTNASPLIYEDTAVDIEHLFATLEGYLYSNLQHKHWIGWGGDLASMVKIVGRYCGSEDINAMLLGAYQLSEKMIGQGYTGASAIDAGLDDGGDIKFSFLDLIVMLMLSALLQFSKMQSTQQIWYQRR